MFVKIDRIRNRARTLLRGHWTQNSWIVSPDGEEWSADKSVWIGWYGDDGHELDGLAGLRAWLHQHDLVDKHGHYKGGCAVCAEGAVWLACALDPKADEDLVESTLSELKQRLPSKPAAYADEQPERYTEIPEFNDDKGTTEKQVLKTLFA